MLGAPLLCSDQSSMDRRSWPWKKKSSDKSAAEKAIATLDSAGVSLASGGTQIDKIDKDNYKKPNYVQISVESYTHLTGLEDTVKAYEDQVKTYEDQFKTLEEQIDELNEKLSDAHSEITSKEELVKQHAKVAEEAVSGWEKAEAEAAALKTHLEAVTLSKLTAEDKAAHLDDALKECMRQIRNLKEEHDQNLEEVVLTKNKHCDNVKREFEARIANLNQELLRAEAENASLSRSLQERSSMLIKTTEEKARAEAEIELLKSNVESCEREINSLKYELHIAAKELEIRNEEKNMSVKSAEVANKQHMEGVKKIAKLEAECQRLRGLVRKKLPGPAALAQMKLEVECLGREYGDTRVRRSPARPPSPQFAPSPHMLSVPDLSLDGPQKFQKENEFLTERLLATEEETKMLKEALSKRNSELQASRSMYAKTASKLQSLEAQLQNGHPLKASLKADITSVCNASNPPSMTSMSEDGNDDAVSVAESWASALISDMSHNKDKNKDRLSRADSTTTNQLELMDDFLEMEKLARMPNDANGTTPINGSITVIKGPENGSSDQGIVRSATDKKPESGSILSSDGAVAENQGAGENPSVVMKVHSRITKVFESISEDADVGKLLEEIKQIAQDVNDHVHQDSVSCVVEEKHCSEDAIVATSSEKDINLLKNGNLGTKAELVLNKEVTTALSQVHAFILLLGKEAKAFKRTSDDDADGLNQKIERFTATLNKVLCDETCLNDFVLALSDVVVNASDLSFSFLGHRSKEADVNSPDYIDKVALPENKASLAERYSSTSSHASDSSSNPEVPQEANLPSIEKSTWKCSLEDFEQMRAEKEIIEKDLAKCMEDLETAKSQLQDTEQLLAEVKSQLATSVRTNSLSDTQLKCMAESYKSLEMRAEEFEREINLLRTKVESLEIELQSEKVGHQEALARCKNLEEELRRRKEDCSACSCSAADQDSKTKQEKDLAAAAEKLAEFQETIFVLGRQLQSMRPQTEVPGWPLHLRSSQKEEEQPSVDRPTTTGLNSKDVPDQAEEVDSVTSANLQPVGAESPTDLYNASSPNEMDANGTLRSPVSLMSPKHRTTKSVSSSSSTPTPEKQSRGFSRFFSSKGRSSH